MSRWEEKEEVRLTAALTELPPTKRGFGTYTPEDIERIRAEAKAEGAAEAEQLTKAHVHNLQRLLTEAQHYQSRLAKDLERVEKLLEESSRRNLDLVRISAAEEREAMTSLLSELAADYCNGVFDNDGRSTWEIIADAIRDRGAKENGT